MHHLPASPLTADVVQSLIETKTELVRVITQLNTHKKNLSEFVSKQQQWQDRKMTHDQNLNQTYRKHLHDYCKAEKITPNPKSDEAVQFFNVLDDKKNFLLYIKTNTEFYNLQLLEKSISCGLMATLCLCYLYPLLTARDCRMEVLCLTPIYREFDMVNHAFLVLNRKAATLSPNVLCQDTECLIFDPYNFFLGKIQALPPQRSLHRYLYQSAQMTLETLLDSKAMNLHLPANHKFQPMEKYILGKMQEDLKKTLQVYFTHLNKILSRLGIAASLNPYDLLPQPMALSS